MGNNENHNHKIEITLIRCGGVYGPVDRGKKGTKRLWADRPQICVTI
jgi:nucleoside-diphosphate-sugar epimerase